MSKLDDIEVAVADLSPAEMAHLLEKVSQELGAAGVGIDRDVSVCGGEARVARTRIPVWLLEQARRLGTSEAEILRAYPTLSAADLVNAWMYVRHHTTEIDQHIRENEEAT